MNYDTSRMNTGTPYDAVRRSPLATMRFLEGTNFKLTAHHILLNQVVMEALAGRHRRLMINLPPQHGKSSFISHALPVWYLSEYPDRRVILTSYEAEFAATFGAKVRESLKGHPSIFRKQLRKDTDKHFTIVGHRGYMQTAGVGGPITGKGADLIIIDDPVKNAEQAGSPTYRKRVWDWYRSTVFTRLSGNAILIVVMTRWHNDDLAGRLIRASDSGEGDRFHTVSLPALAGTNDPLGRAVGEALAPELYSRDQLEAIKRVVGPYWWSSLYGNSPSSDETQIILRTWWQQYDVPPNFEFVYQSWDTAMKDDESNDYSCCTTWGVGRLGLYLIDIFYEKLQYPQLREAVKNLASRHNPNVILIEDKSAGTSVIQDLRVNTRLPIVPWAVDGGSKVLRLRLNSGLFYSGRVFIPYGPQYTDLIEEIAQFPKVEHDDRTDSVSQAVSFYRTRFASYSPDEGAAVERLTSGGGRRSSSSRNNGFM